MSQFWFSSVTLKNENRLNAIASLLLPESAPNKESPVHAHHKLIWSLFSDDPNKTRDFIWRHEKHRSFYILSERPPENDFFEIKVTHWQPQLRPGDLLSFSLRANPVKRIPYGEKRETISKITGTKRMEYRTKKVDVVMHALQGHRATLSTPDGSSDNKLRRSQLRDQFVQQEGQKWLQNQGEEFGFTLRKVQCEGYHQHVLPRKQRGPKSAMRFSTLDFRGILEINDPEKFCEQHAKGFGPAKAYGCGLMLLQRASHIS